MVGGERLAVTHLPPGSVEEEAAGSNAQDEQPPGRVSLGDSLGFEILGA